MKVLNLMNYRYNSYPIFIDMDNLDEITITVISGDEIADILYLDGTSDQIDAADLANDHRLMDFWDGSYIVYSVRRGINRMELFTNRENSYSMLWVVDDEEE